MKPSRFAISSLCLAATTLVTTAAAQNAPAGTGISGSPVFQNNCARCHGKEAEGHHMGPPSLISGRVPKKPADDLRAVITKGKGHMPAFGDKLTAGEIDTLIQQIKDYAPQ